MGPQVERCFERSESPVNVVKVDATVGNEQRIVRCTRQYVFNIKLKLFKIRGNNSQWKQLKNSFRWQRLEVTQIQSKTVRQIPSGDSRPTNCQVVSYGCQDYNVLC